MPALMPVDISGMDGKENIEYSNEVIELLKILLCLINLLQIL